MTIKLQQLGLQDYLSCWQSMQYFTKSRNVSTQDEIWILEHNPVFTQGLNGHPKHVLQTSNIPLVKSDRGGQITYHAPGQLIVYTLIDLKRRQLGVRDLVTILEQSMMNTLAQYGLSAQARADAPGVYINNEKIGSLGLRIKKGCSYHGLSLNNQMDMQPFSYINPCGYQGMRMTQLMDHGVNIRTSELAVPVVNAIMQALA